MEPAVQPKKLIQYSEQIFNPVKIPIIINNEMYVMEQQDVRHIEETRHISYAKVSYDGQLMPIDQQVPAFNPNSILTCPTFNPNPIVTPPIISPQTFQFTSPNPPQCPQFKSQSFVQNVMDCIRNNQHSTPGFPFHYSESTSTSDINIPRSCHRETKQCGSCAVKDKSCMVKEVSCRGINTDKLISKDDDDPEDLSALELLKLKKMNDSDSSFC